MTSEQERSQWGRSMLAKRGGYAVQQLYREEGRVGDQHPAHKAAKNSAEKRRERKIKRELEKQYPQGSPTATETRHKLLPTCWGSHSF